MSDGSPGGMPARRRRVAHPRGPRRHAGPGPPRRIGVDPRGPVPGPGRDAAVRSSASARRPSPGSGSPVPTPPPPCRSPAAARSRSSTRRWPGPPATARAVADAIAARRADPVAAPVPLRPEPGILELRQGDWEGVTQDEIARRWPAELSAWRHRPWESVAPGGETLAEVQARVRPALGRVLRAPRSRLPARHLRPAAGRRVRGRRRGPRPAVVDPRRPRRRVQGGPADAVRAAADAVLDVQPRAHRDHRGRVPGRPSGAAGAQPDRRTSRRWTTSGPARRPSGGHAPARSSGRAGPLRSRSGGRRSPAPLSRVALSGVCRRRLSVAATTAPDQQAEQRDPQASRRRAHGVQALAAEAGARVGRLHLRRRHDAEVVAGDGHQLAQRRGVLVDRLCRPRREPEPRRRPGHRPPGRVRAQLAPRAPHPGGDQPRPGRPRPAGAPARSAAAAPSLCGPRRGAAGARPAARRGRRAAWEPAGPDASGADGRRRGARDGRPGLDDRRAPDAAAGRVERDPAVAREVDLHPGVGVAVADGLHAPDARPGRNPWTRRVGIGLVGFAARSRIAIVEA